MRARYVAKAAIALAGPASIFLAIAAFLRAGPGAADQVYTPSQVRDGLRQHPRAWLNRIVWVHGIIGSTCYLDEAPGVISTSNCALPPVGAPLDWISDGPGPATAYDVRRSLGFEIRMILPPRSPLEAIERRLRPSKAPIATRIQMQHAGTFPVLLHVASPCPVESVGTVPSPPCVMGEIDLYKLS